MNASTVTLEEENLFIQQYQLSMLSQLAYYVESNGQAVVINPVRDISQYTQLAQSRNAKILFILLTHLPADYVSGHLSLHIETSAPILIGPSSDVKFQAKILQDNEIIPLGNYQFRVLYTPGHTIESCCFKLEKTTENCQGLALFSGNTLLLGDTCGPDQTEAKSVEDSTYLASLLYDSLRNKILPLDDSLIIYPGHCSGFRIAPKITNGLKDTLGNQKKVNRALQNIAREQFIEETLQSLVAIPQNYHYISQLNRQLTSAVELEQQLKSAKKSLTVDEILQLQKEGTTIIDCRPYTDFLNGFIDKSINMTLATKIELWISMIYSPISSNFALICQNGKEEETYTRLARIGFDFAIQGMLDGGFESYVKSGKPIQSIQNVDAQTFKNEIFPKHPYSMDVRDETDFQVGHIQNSTNIPVNQMADLCTNNTDPFPRDQPVYVFCNGGGRAPIGCSLLRANGYTNVIHVVGGMSKLKENGIELIQE